MKLAIARNGMGLRLGTRTLALGLASSMIAPGLVAGCGGGGSQQAAAPPPPAGNYNPPSGMQGQRPSGMQGQRPGAMQAQRPGMSTKTKVLLIGGAALAYYLWKKHRNAQNQPLPQGVQLYRSKNGGIYYRDAQNPQNITYVVPPRAQQFNQTMQVDPSEVQGLGLDQYQGYPGGSGNTGLDAVRQLVPLPPR